jgi:hypothetical protein
VSPHAGTNPKGRSILKIQGIRGGSRQRQVHINDSHPPATVDVNQADLARALGTCAIAGTRNPTNVAKSGSAEHECHGLNSGCLIFEFGQKIPCAFGRFGVHAYELYLGIVGH